MRGVRRPELTQLTVGLAIIVLGILLLLQAEGSIELDGGWLAAGLSASAGAALLASGLGARER